MILDELVRSSTAGAAQRESLTSLKELEKCLGKVESPRGFVAALLGAPGVGLIGELKPASPSAGIIREPFAVRPLAQELVRGGANCLSVLTEVQHFHGALENLALADVGVPRLQKDFVVSEYQIVEGRSHGADAVLLIAEVLAPQRAAQLCELALSLGMDVLYEAHDVKRMQQVVQLAETQPDRILVGINNRDLRTFQVDLLTTVHALGWIPEHLHVVGESGIHSPADVQQLCDAGVRGLLVGESLMRQEHVEQAVRTLLSRVRGASGSRGE